MTYFDLLDMAGQQPQPLADSEVPQMNPNTGVAFHATTTHVRSQMAPTRPLQTTGGLAQEHEYSTGYSMRPVRVEEFPLINDVRGGRVSFAVILGIIAVIVAATMTTVMVFAAPR